MWCRLLAICVILVVSAANRVRASDSVLWRAYAHGTEKKWAELRACFRRLAELHNRAKARTEEIDWGKQDEFRWLLKHRTPASLAVERELSNNPEAPYLEVLLRLASRLGKRRFSHMLPDLLEEVDMTRSKHLILQTMSKSGDRECQTALKDFLDGAGRFTPEHLLLEAVKGLSSTGDERYLPLFERIGQRLESPMARARLAFAMYRCGSIEAKQNIIRLLQEDGTDRKARLWAVGCVGREPFDEAVSALVSLATRPPGRLSDAALRSLFRIRFTVSSPTKNVIQLAGEEPAQEGPRGNTQDREAMPTQSLGELGVADRKRLAHQAVQAWRQREHPERETTLEKTRRQGVDMRH
jgi:hypothetical protein